MNPQFYIVESLNLAIERINHELYLGVVLAVGVGHKVKRRLLNLNTAAAGVAEGYQLFVHGLGHVPDHFAIVFVFGRVNVEEKRHHLRAASPELDRLTRLALGDAPHLCVIERPVLDLVHHVRPAPASVNFVQKRARRVVQPRRGGLFWLQMVALEAGPALQRVMMPGAPRHIFIHVQVAVRQDVQSSALLITYHHGHRVLKLLAKAHVEHAGVERASPHAHVTPAGTRKRPRGCTGENQIGGSGEHGFLQTPELYVHQ